MNIKNQLNRKNVTEFQKIKQFNITLKMQNKHTAECCNTYIFAYQFSSDTPEIIKGAVTELNQPEIL